MNRRRFIMDKIEINNSYEAAVKSGKWGNPGASFYDKIKHSKTLLNEAYLEVGDVDKDTSFSASECKFPHHCIVNGELVVSIPGIKAAYSRAKQMGKFSGEIKRHLEKHYKAMGIYKDSNMYKESVMEDRFQSIYNVLGINPDEFMKEEVIQESVSKEYDMFEDYFIPRGITTPEKLLEFMNGIEYDDDDKHWKLRDPYKDNHKYGNCHDQSLLEKVWFNHFGYECGQIFFIEYREGEDKGGRTHTLTWFKDNDKYYWFENAWHDNRGIHGPFESLKELKDFVHSKWEETNNTFPEDEKYNDIEFFDVPNYRVGMDLAQYVDSWTGNYNEQVSWISRFINDQEFRESVFEEASHGRLKYDFRFGYNVDNGKIVKIVYDLNPNMDGNYKSISSSGDKDHRTGGQKVLAIIEYDTKDMSDKGHRLQEVDYTGSVAHGTPNHVKVGEIDTEMTYKTTHSPKKHELSSSLISGIRNLQAEHEGLRSKNRGVAANNSVIKAHGGVKGISKTLLEDMACIDLVSPFNSTTLESIPDYKNNGEFYKTLSKIQNDNNDIISIVGVVLQKIRAPKDFRSGFASLTQLMNSKSDRIHSIADKIRDVFTKYNISIDKYSSKLNPSNNLKNILEESANIIEDSDIEDKWFIKSDDGVDNCCIKVKGYDKPMRGRSSMIVLGYIPSKEAGVNVLGILGKKNSNDYGVPGGGWNKDEDPKDAAIRELHEETLEDVKDVHRMGTLIEYHKDVAKWVKDHVKDEKDWWYGYYSAVFVGKYNGKFHGQVDEKDRESGCKWYEVNDIWEKLPKEYRKAISDYLNTYSLPEDIQESVDLLDIEVPMDEASHGKLKYDFRIVKDAKTGHELILVYDLKNINVSYPGHAHDISDFNGIAKDNATSKELKDANVKAQKSIAKTGNIDHQSSGQTLIAVKDKETGEQWSAEKNPGKEFSVVGYYADKIYDSTPKTVKLGEVDNNPTFKSTLLFNNMNFLSNIEGILKNSDRKSSLPKVTKHFKNDRKFEDEFNEMSRDTAASMKYALRYLKKYGDKDPKEMLKAASQFKKGNKDEAIKLGITSNEDAELVQMEITRLANSKKLKRYAELFPLKVNDEERKLLLDALKSGKYKMSLIFGFESTDVDEDFLSFYGNALFTEADDDKIDVTAAIENNIKSSEDSKEEPQESEEEQQLEEIPVEEPQPEEETIEEPVEEPKEEIKEEPPKEEAPKEPTSLPKQTDKAEVSKNGVNRKKLYIAFIEYCKDINPKNVLSSVFDKDVFHITYPFVPNEMRYFYRLANPTVCILQDNMAFFELSELKKINSENPEFPKKLVFAGTPEMVYIFDTDDKKVYTATEGKDKLTIKEKVGDSFDLFIQDMVGQGDILNAPPEIKEVVADA